VNKGDPIWLHLLDLAVAIGATLQGLDLIEVLHRRCPWKGCGYPKQTGKKQSFHHGGDWFNPSYSGDYERLIQNLDSSYSSGWNECA
jgi:hypothetical protein